MMESFNDATVSSPGSSCYDPKVQLKGYLDRDRGCVIKVLSVKVHNSFFVSSFPNLGPQYQEWFFSLHNI